MTRRSAPKGNPKVTTTPIGRDVDLGREDVRLRSGRRLTQELADELVKGVRTAGARPSLSGEATRSPQIAFPVPAELRERAPRIVAAEGKTLSQLAREALEQRLAGPAVHSRRLHRHVRGMATLKRHNGCQPGRLDHAVRQTARRSKLVR